MSADRIVFFDLETGGLDPQRHPVIQFAGVAVEDWREVETLEVKLAFRMDACEPEALEGNCYDARTWTREAVAPADAVLTIDAFLRRHATLDIPKKSGRGTWRACQLAGHNAQRFDRYFLAAMMRDGGVPGQAATSRDFLQRLFDAFGAFCVGGFLVLDTCDLALWWSRGLPPDRRPPNLQLPTLAAHFGIEHAGAHDALADVRANVQVARRLLEEMAR